MPSTFAKTMRSLEGDRSRRSVIALLIALVILACWGVWALLAEVPVYEVTGSARLEVSSRPHPVVTRTAGRVVLSNLQLGVQVTDGQVLVELDAEAQRIDLEEGQARLSDLGAQQQALQAQVDALGQAISAHEEANQAAAQEAQAWTREAQARLDWAEQDADRLERLRQDNLATGHELDQAQAEVHRLQAELRALRQSAERTVRQGQAEQQDRYTQLAELQQDLAAIEGRIAIEQVAIRRLEHEIEKHLVRAPVSGEVAECQDLQPGMVLATGTTVATVIPPGDLTAVAQFRPSSAGRIHHGDGARLRFPGFPWMQYGTLSATVARVANEVRDGTIRVDLAIHPADDTAIPLQHSLPAVVEIEVERVSPLTLVLRAVGGLFEGGGETTTDRGPGDAAGR